MVVMVFDEGAKCKINLADLHEVQIFTDSVIPGWNHFYAVEEEKHYF